MIKYRFVEVNSDGELIHKFPSKELPAGTIHQNMDVLLPNGNLYKVVNVSLDIEIAPVDPEIHVELFLKEDRRYAL